MNKRQRKKWFNKQNFVLGDFLDLDNPAECYGFRCLQNELPKELKCFIEPKKRNEVKFF